MVLAFEVASECAWVVEFADAPCLGILPERFAFECVEWGCAVAYCLIAQYTVVLNSIFPSIIGVSRKREKERPNSQRTDPPTPQHTIPAYNTTSAFSQATYPSSDPYTTSTSSHPHHTSHSPPPPGNSSSRA